MRLHSQNLELAALRSITGPNDLVASRIFSRVNEDFFEFEHTREAFMRLQRLARKHGELPRWSDLLEDMTISQDSRDELASRDVDPARSKKECDEIVKQLDQYRKARVLYRGTRKIQETMKGESVDLDSLTDEMVDLLNSSKSTTDIAEHTTLIGGRRADMRILKQALTETTSEFIPTGFKVFDRENQGIPRGSLFILSATSGGGKSLIALQIAIHQASIGAKVVIISLEMNQKVVVRRILSHITGIPLSMINRAHTLDGQTRRALIRAWEEYNARVRAQGGSLRIVAPPDDVSLTEVLAMYRPYHLDNLIVDYLGLMKGLDSEDQWRRLGSAAREAERFAAAENSIVTLLAQLSDEGRIRYSRTIQEHAHLMWTWTYVDEAVKESRIITVKQPKTRNLKSFDFHLREDFAHMKVSDLDPSERDQIVRARGASKGKTKTGRISMKDEGSPNAEFQM